MTNRVQIYSLKKGKMSTLMAWGWLLYGRASPVGNVEVTMGGRSYRMEDKAPSDISNRRRERGQERPNLSHAWS